MPAFYAHDRFGRKVYSRLDGEIKQTIKKHSRQFVFQTGRRDKTDDQKAQPAVPDRAAGTGSLFLLPALASK